MANSYLRPPHLLRMLGSSFRLASSWLIASINKISRKVKERIVFCVILNIATEIMKHLVVLAGCVPIGLSAK